ncbi:MAG: hypothetical protein ABII74_06360 [Elusimicrobiota bacterium]
MDQLFFYDFRNKKKDSVGYYLLSAIIKLQKKMECFRGNIFLEEEVNVYLAGVLLSLLVGRLFSDKLISLNDTDIFQLLSKTKDVSEKYSIYKVNADHLLVCLGIFNNIGTSFKDSHCFYGRRKETYVGRLQDYYLLASSYHQKIYRQQTILSQVLEQLSHNLSNYLQLLSFLRQDYFCLTKTVSKEEFAVIIEQAKQSQREILLQKKRDLFLDAYSYWLKTKQPEALEKLNFAVADLKAVDPDFSFKLKE